MYCHLFWKIVVFIDAAIKRNEAIKTTINVVPSPPVLNKSRIRVSIKLKTEIYLTMFVVFINVQLACKIRNVNQEMEQVVLACRQDPGRREARMTSFCR